MGRNSNYEAIGIVTPRLASQVNGPGSHYFALTQPSGQNTYGIIRDVVGGVLPILKIPRQEKLFLAENASLHPALVPSTAVCAGGVASVCFFWLGRGDIIRNVAPNRAIWAIRFTALLKTKP